MKRKSDSDDAQPVTKRVRSAEDTGSVAQSNLAVKISAAPPDNAPKPMTTDKAADPKQRRRIKKLAPPRPFPVVPTSVSATGPRSAHKEGKNFICVTRKTPLGSYMRRCKDVIIKDGCGHYCDVRYKMLNLSAMGAAIPHLLQLAMALPPILPFASDEIHMQTTTGTVEVTDEVLPDDEDEDISYETRGKSTLSIVIKLGDSLFEGDNTVPIKRNGKTRPSSRRVKGKLAQAPSAEIVLQEPEQESMEML